MLARWRRAPRPRAEARLTIPRPPQPGAKKPDLAGRTGAAVKSRRPAPPVDGKANEALIKFIAETLHLPKSAVNLKSGQTSRRKVLEVCGAEASSITALARDEKLS